jgi:hypothetical protein
MQAIQFRRLGGYEQLEVVDVPVPAHRRVKTVPRGRCCRAGGAPHGRMAACRMPGPQRRR